MITASENDLAETVVEMNFKEVKDEVKKKYLIYKKLLQNNLLREQLKKYSYSFQKLLLRSAV